MSELTHKPAGIASKQALIQRLFYQVSAGHFFKQRTEVAGPIRPCIAFYRFQNIAQKHN
jgi:hypothetical protein